MALWLGAPALSCTLRVVTEDWSFRESAPSAEFARTTAALDDPEFLDMIERATFRYFWQGAHPVSGLIRERSSSGDICATGGTGFGLMAIPVGIERGYVTRAAGRGARAADAHLPRRHRRELLGRVPALDRRRHRAARLASSARPTTPWTWSRPPTSPRACSPCAGTSTAPARTRRRSARWPRSCGKAIEWDAFRAAGEDALRWHRSPTTGLSSAYVSGWNECMITYLLARGLAHAPGAARLLPLRLGAQRRHGAEPELLRLPALGGLRLRRADVLRPLLVRGLRPALQARRLRQLLHAQPQPRAGAGRLRRPRTPAATPATAPRLGAHRQRRPVRLPGARRLLGRQRHHHAERRARLDRLRAERGDRPPRGTSTTPTAPRCGASTASRTPSTPGWAGRRATTSPSTRGRSC